MEVHHHSHTARKKWTHYFWEFLMLFLAITLGFLVENMREHYIEHKRAKILARSLMEDLKKDTAALQEAIAFSQAKAESMTGLIDLLHQPPASWNDSLLYYYSHYFPRIAPFVSTRGTYEQIKNSGSLRYFPQRMVSLMNSYNVYSIRAEDRDALDTKQIVESFIPFSSRMMNFEVYNDLIYKNPVRHRKYVNIDPKDIDQFINYAVVSRRGRDRSLMEYNQLLQHADSLFIELKKEYKLQ